MSLSQHHPPLYVGNSVYMLWLLQQSGSVELWDVSAANLITLDVEDAFGATVAVVTANPAHPGADWSQGEVMFFLTPANIMATRQSLRYTLTVEKSGQVLSVEHGILEVLARPGYPLLDVGDVYASTATAGAVATIV